MDRGFPDVELRQLEYFRMVCRENNITKAAGRLHVSQPSVTVGIQRLEEELGVKLLDRSEKKIAITAEGRIFLQRAEEILARVGDSVAEMNDYRLNHGGSIRVGITAIMGAVLFPSAFSRFRRDYPNVQITVLEEGSLSVRNRLESGDLDIGIMITSDLPPRLESLPISTGQILVCLPFAHPLGERSSIPMNELRDQPFILFREDTYSRRIILEECAKFGFTPRIVFSSSQIGTVLELVKQGVGISFFIEEVLHDQAGVLSRPLAEPLFLVAGLAWNRERYLSHAAGAFIDSFRKTLSGPRKAVRPLPTS
jgi:DNA-binding transcriptional LysR family regulator